MIKRSKDKLHRVDVKSNSDWENLSVTDKNIAQKIAAKTGGLITPV